MGFRDTLDRARNSAQKVASGVGSFASESTASTGAVARAALTNGREGAKGLLATLKDIPRFAQQLPVWLDAKLREKEAGFPPIEDAAVKDAFGAIQKVLGDEFIEVTPYNFYLKFQNLAAHMGRHAGEAVRGIPGQFTLGDFASAFTAVASGEGHVDTMEAGFFGGQRRVRKHIARVLVDKTRQASNLADTNDVPQTIAQRMARAVMLWGSETPMDLYRGATAEAGAEGVKRIEPILHAALVDEALQVLGMDYAAEFTKRNVTHRQGMLEVMETAEKHGAKGTVIKALGNKGQELLTEGLKARSERAGVQQTDEVHQRRQSVVGAAEKFAVEAALKLAGRLDIPGLGAADDLFKDEAAEVMRAYDEALREGAVAYVSRVLAGPDNERRKEVVRIVAEADLSIEAVRKQGRSFGEKWGERLSRKPAKTVAEHLAAGYAKRVVAAQNKLAQHHDELAGARELLASAIGERAQFDPAAFSRDRERKAELSRLDAAVQSARDTVTTLQDQTAGLEQSTASDKKLVGVFEKVESEVSLDQVKRAKEQREKAERKGSRRGRK